MKKDNSESSKNTTYFRPYKGERSFEAVSGEIKKLIFQGVFKAGDKLPPETEIGRQFGVSRQTVREALRILEQSGFITIQQGVNGGPMITDTVLSRLSNMFLDIFYFKRLSLDELTEARFGIEKAMFKHVIERVEETDVEALKKNVEEAKIKLEKNDTPFEENIEFHRILARASKNFVYMIVIELLMSVVSHFHSERNEKDLKKSARIVHLHEAILEGIVEKDYDRSVLILDELLKEVRTILTKKGQNMA
ncbi:MAG: GntR family transcriptional regulator [Syntrophorhabdaceae bacterium]|nr:GntR family transcriptional regulator [Syntrophorhabdaceae bacterium]